eukprot:m.443811 g.443811  ORF g.443811 m.443811 type:complete len:564 (-) comp19016_c0_seq1:26-1717(-)
MSGLSERDVRLVVTGAVVGAAAAVAARELLLRLPKKESCCPPLDNAGNDGTGAARVSTPSTGPNGAQPSVQAQLRLSRCPETVHQTSFDPATGNSLQACVASLFGLPLSKVPNFVVDPDGYETAIARFVQPSGWAVRKIRLDAGSSIDGLPSGCAVILRGKSPRGDHGHVVIARVSEQQGSSPQAEFDLLMDPHPEGGFLDPAKPYGWAMVIEAGPNAPGVALVGNAQRIVHWLHPTTPWRVLGADSADGFDSLPRDGVAAIVLGPQARPYLSKLLDLAFFPQLKLVQSMSAGYDWLDLPSVDASLTVCNTSSMDHAIAEYVVAAFLHFEIGLVKLAEAMRSPPYLFVPPFHRRPIDASGTLGCSPFRSELKGQTVGIVGLGKIGQQIAARVAPFGVRLIATRGRAQPIPPPNFDWVGQEGDLDRLLAESDYVVMACPLTPATTGLIDKRRLALMKPTAVLVNVARGPVVEEAALYAALKDGLIRGAAIDVWYKYPKNGEPDGVAPSQYPFHDLDPHSVLLTPHSSGWTVGQERRKVDQIAANLDALATGATPSFVIRPPQPQ